jgi:hypothetical protein
VAGGQNPGAIASAEIYDPKTGVFSMTGSMATARGRQNAILLGDGKVLMLGGSTGLLGKSISSAELYDPTTGTFSSAGSMSTRSGFSATLLQDGHVLIAGGRDASGYLSSAELYVP